MSPRQMMTSLLALLLAVGTHSEDTSAEGPLGSAGCEYDGMLYAAGQAITVGGCESWRCVNSNWKVSGKLNPNKMAPCPPGAFPYRQSCLTEEPLWLTRGEAAGICQIKGGRLLELYGEDEPHTEDARRQLAAALNPGGGYWATAAEPASDGLCAAVPPGAIDKEVVQLRCDMRLRPVCVIPRGPCDQGVCTVNEHTYDNNTVIETIDQCTSIVCLNSYPMTVIDETCCEFENSAGVTRLYTSGSHIKTIDQCTSIVCRDSSPTNVIDDTCCEFENSDGLTIVYTAGSKIETCSAPCFSTVCLNGSPTDVIDYTCPAPDCCPGFTLCADRCWHAAATEYTYDAAEQYCSDKGAILGTPRSPEENTCAADVAKRADDYAYFWIGYRGGNTVESLVGDDDKGGITYDNWAAREPRLYFAENCAAMYVRDGYWRGGSCRREVYVLCQMKD